MEGTRRSGYTCVMRILHRNSSWTGRSERGRRWGSEWRRGNGGLTFRTFGRASGGRRGRRRRRRMK